MAGYVAEDAITNYHITGTLRLATELTPLPAATVVFLNDSATFAAGVSKGAACERTPVTGMSTGLKSGFLRLPVFFGGASGDKD